MRGEQVKELARLWLVIGHPSREMEETGSACEKNEDGKILVVCQQVKLKAQYQMPI